MLLFVAAAAGSATTARARGHAAARATAAASTTLATEPATAAVAAATTVAALAVAAVATRHRLEAVVGGRGGSRTALSLGVVVGPRLRVGRRSGCRGKTRLRLARLARDLDVHPLLRARHVVARVPLALAGGVGRVIRNVGIAGGAAGRGLLDVAVGQGDGRALLDLGQAGISDRRVGLGLLLGLDSSLSVGSLRTSLGLGERGSQSGGGLLDLGDWEGLVTHMPILSRWIALTGSLQGITTRAARLLVRALHQLQHGGNGVLVARIDVQEDALECHVLVRRRIRILGTAGGRKAEELREDEEVVVEGNSGVRLGLLRELSDRIGLFLGELVRQGLLLLLEPHTELLVDLLVLRELLLELEQLGLEGGLLEVRGLLVGVDDLGRHELVERLAPILGDDGVDLGGVGLKNDVCQYFACTA